MRKFIIWENKSLNNCYYTDRDDLEIPVKTEYVTDQLAQDLKPKKKKNKRKTNTKWKDC